MFLNQFAAQLAFDSTGRLYTVGSEFNRFAADGTPLGAFVTGFDSGGLAIDRQDNVYLSDLSGDVVRKFSPSGALLATISSASMDGPGNLLILVPEPATATLIASVTVAGLFFRRKVNQG